MKSSNDMMWCVRAQMQREDTTKGFTVYEEDLRVIEILSEKPRHILVLDTLAKAHGLAAITISKEAIGRLHIEPEGGEA